MYFSVALVFVFVFVSHFNGAECSGNRSTCELGWLFHNSSESCYRFYPAALSWQDASTSCTAQGGLLAIINDNSTNDFITTNVTRGLRTWIGLHNKNNSRGWQWGTVNRSTAYTNWAPGEPNNFYYPFYSEECTEIEDASGQWNDETCDSLRSYVCQKSLGCKPNQLRGLLNYDPTINGSRISIGTEVTIETQCRVGYRPVNQTTTTTCLPDGSWSKATYNCTEIYCNDPSGSVLPNGKIHSPTGPFPVGSAIQYTCDIGYMLHGNSVTMCRDVDSRIPFGVWDQPPICLKSPECDAGWISHNNYCYKYVQELMTWHQADARCQAIGGEWSRLVAINRHGENSLVQQLTMGATSVWIGLYDAPSEGLWKWTDASFIEYENWAPGEPNNGQFFWEDEDCVELDPLTGLWNDEECDVLREFICEKFVAN